MASEASAPRLSFGFSGFSRQAVVVAALMIGALALGLSVAALIVRLSPGSASGSFETAAHFRALPLLPAMAPAAATPALTQAGAGFGQRLAAASLPPNEPIHIGSPPERIAPSP